MKRNNNFDLIRFCLASTVFLVHSHVLSQNAALAPLSRFLSSDIAVKAFFVVSGFLVFQSYERSRSLSDYAAKRVRRVYPAYAAVILLAAAAGALVTTVPLEQYFSGQLLRYLAANLVFLNFLAPTLPGVFTGNLFEEVNGALWTLKIEVMFYLSVPVIAWLIRRLGLLPVTAVLYVGSVAYFLGLSHLADVMSRPFFDQLARQLPGQLAFFMAGALLYYRFDALRRWLLPAACVSVLLLALHLPYVDPWLQPICLAFVVIGVAFGFPYLGNFGRFGDFSYGIYILHFPILQWMVWQGWFAANPFSALAVACGVVLAAAYASWHLVEKPFLLRSSHYVQATRE
jgi:peptidoglycan/LPS O-acetylase OafA/YrhL